MACENFYDVMKGNCGLDSQRMAMKGKERNVPWVNPDTGLPTNSGVRQEREQYVRGIIKPRDIQELSIFDDIQRHVNVMRTGPIRNIRGEDVMVKGAPNPQKFNDFYGDVGGINTLGTFINERLLGVIPQSIHQHPNILPEAKALGNVVYVGMHQGKTYLCLYSGGILQVATYVAVGRNNPTDRTLIAYGQNVNNDKITPDSLIYKRSQKSKLPGEKIWTLEYNGSTQFADAAMWKPIHIAWGKYLHGTGSSIKGGHESGGCVRVPLLYQHRIYEIVNQWNSSGQDFAYQFAQLY